MDLLICDQDLQVGAEGIEDRLLLNFLLDGIIELLPLRLVPFHVGLSPELVDLGGVEVIVIVLILREELGEGTRVDAHDIASEQDIIVAVLLVLFDLGERRAVQRVQLEIDPGFLQL